MDVLFEVFFEVIFELIFEGILPALIPHYNDSVKAKRSKGIIIASFYILVFIIAIMNAIFNSVGTKSTLFFISLSVFSLIMIISSICRAKYVKFQYIYKLNYIAILFSFIISIIEGILVINSDYKYNILYGVLIISFATIICVYLLIVYYFKIKKAYKIQHLIDERVLNNDFDYQRIIAFNKYKEIYDYGYTYYFKSKEDPLEDFSYIESAISGREIRYFNKALKAYKENNYELVKKYDEVVKKYKKNVDNYLYCLLYIDTINKED